MSASNLSSKSYSSMDITLGYLPDHSSFWINVDHSELVSGCNYRWSEANGTAQKYVDTLIKHMKAKGLPNGFTVEEREKNFISPGIDNYRADEISMDISLSPSDEKLEEVYSSPDRKQIFKGWRSTIKTLFEEAHAATIEELGGRITIDPRWDNIHYYDKKPHIGR